MRKVFGGALVAMFLTFVGTGNAIEFKEFTDIQYPDTDFLLDKYHNTYSFTHDITDNGFKSTAYTITSADISLAFYDNVDHVGRFPDIFDLIKEHEVSPSTECPRGRRKSTQKRFIFWLMLSFYKTTGHCR